jgi:hypothetical protein
MLTYLLLLYHKRIQPVLYGIASFSAVWLLCQRAWVLTRIAELRFGQEILDKFEYFPIKCRVQRAKDELKSAGKKQAGSPDCPYETKVTWIKV